METNIMIKNKEMLKEFLRTGIVQSLLDKFRITFADSDEQKKGRLTVNSEPDCYTDMLNIVVGMIPNFLANDFGKDAFGQELNRILKTKGHRGLWLLIYKTEYAHEMQHKNSTSEKDAKYCREEIKNHLNSKYSINKIIAENFAANLFNIIEDGRIENIVIQKFKGLRLPFLLLNSQIRNGCAIDKKPENSKEEFITLMNCILSYAKTAYLPKGQQHVKNTEVIKQYEKIENYIDKGVEGKRCIDCAEACISITKEIGEYLAGLLKSDSDLVDMLEKLIDNNVYSNNEKDFNSDDGNSKNTLRIGKIKKKKNEDKAEEKNKGTEKSKDKNAEENKTRNSDINDNNDKQSENKKEKSPCENSEENKEDKKDEDKNNDAIKNNNTNEDDESVGNGKSDDENKNKDDDDNKNNDNNEGKDDDNNNDDENKNPDNDGENKKSNDDNLSENADSNSKDEENNSKSSDDNNKNEDSTGDKSSEDDTMEEKIWSDEEIDKIDELIKESMNEIEREEVLITKKNNVIKSSLTNQDIKDVKQKYSQTNFKEITYDLIATEIPIDIRNLGNMFRRDVEKILFIKNETQRGLKRGILDPTALWKIGVRDGNVFEKKGAKKKDYAFYLLQDGSGSMYGTKEIETATTLSIIEEGLRDYSAIKITTFAANHQCVFHHTAKQFDDNRKFNHSYAFLKKRRADGSNKDGFSIRIATKELLKRQEKKKVLFVLSDGLPSQYRGGRREGKEDIKKAVEEARSKGIEVIAVMFGDDNFISETRQDYEYMYQYGIVSCNPKDIGRKLIPILKNIVKH